MKKQKEGRIRNRTECQSEKQKEEIIRLLSDFVAIPSVNPGDHIIEEDPAYGEKEYAQYVRKLMQEKGYDCSEQEVLPGRPNLIISASKALGKKPIILLQTHSDVVDAKEMEHAFCAWVEKGRLWGRGSCDAKGQLCAMIMAMEQLKEEQDQLPFDICIALCCDEEFRHRGVDEFLSWEHQDKVAAVIVGEPTDMRLASACKGSIRFCIETTGLASHTSMPEKGVNAIYLMAEIIQIIQEKIELQTICKRDERCGNATIAVSLIQGGTIVNSVPDHCIIHVDRRMIPGEQWEEVYQEIQSMIRESLSEEEQKRVRFGFPYLIDPSYKAQLPQHLECEMQEVLRKHGLEEEIVGLPYGCDASKLAKWNIPVFIFGPGSIKQAHTQEEYIEINQIMTASDALKDMILSFA